MTARRAGAAARRAEIAAEPRGGPDVTAMRRGLELFLEGLGALTPAERERAARTTADCWAWELASGVGKDPAGVLVPLRVRGRVPDVVMVEDIDVTSICPHHLLPMRGQVHVAYAPSSLIAPLGHLTLLARQAAARPILQEELAELVVDALERALAPQGAACVVVGRHDCMQLRGSRAAKSQVSVLAARGSLASPDAKRDLMLRLGGPASDGHRRTRSRG